MGGRGWGGCLDWRRKACLRKNLLTVRVRQTAGLIHTAETRKSSSVGVGGFCCDTVEQ